MTTVAIVDDDEGVREHVENMVGGAQDFRCVGSWSNAEEALPAMLATPPDIVLMDVHLPGMSGIECVAALKEKASKVRVLILTAYEDSERVFRALGAGADGYLVKRDIRKKLLSALREMLSGGAPMSSHIARQVVSYFHKPVAPTKIADKTQLTTREEQVLVLLAKGSIYKEIAETLEIGYETVRTHVHNVYQKLHVRTRTEAVVHYLGSVRKP